MGKNLKYWYFRFTKDFFDNKTMMDLKRLPAFSGYRYIVIYLEMCSLCLKCEGETILKIPIVTQGDTYSSYLSQNIGEDQRAIEEAVSYFEHNGYLEIYRDEFNINIDFIKMENNIGKSSTSADKQRRLEHKRKRLQGNKNQMIEQGEEIKEEEESVFSKVLKGR
ncbi:MAG: phage replisome organizer N-terminal domain-containing protein [Hornefia sp.]|nr:phage replisome organizer N-terminal domain-containing protein [Hornefia sp.]